MTSYDEYKRRRRFPWGISPSSWATGIFWGVVIVVLLIGYFAPQTFPKTTAAPGILTGQPDGNTTAPKEVPVVIDGYTVRIGSDIWRLAGVDAPAIEQARCDGERMWGKRAKARLQEALRDKPYRIEESGKPDAEGMRLGKLLVEDQDYAVLTVREGTGTRQYEEPRDKGWWCMAVNLSSFPSYSDKKWIKLARESWDDAKTYARALCQKRMEEKMVTTRYKLPEPYSVLMGCLMEQRVWEMGASEDR